MSFEIKIISEKENPLLERKEIEFIIFHAGQGTPKRVDIRKKLAAILNKDVDCVYIEHLYSKTGKPETRGEARIYKRKEKALAIEPKHIIERNKIEKEEKEAEK